MPPADERECEEPGFVMAVRLSRHTLGTGSGDTAVYNSTHRRAEKRPLPDWPAHRTDVLCWHCCHPFDTQPLPLPIKYDEKRDTYKVHGIFCSWGCMKRFNLESSNYLKNVTMSHISIMKKKWTGDGKTAHILPSPPRCALKAFGGWMTIDEFRAKSSSGMAFHLLPPKMIIEPNLVEEYSAAERYQMSKVDLTSSVDLSKVQTKNDTLKLKRQKPLNTHGRHDLLKSLGHKPDPTAAA